MSDEIVHNLDGCEISLVGDDLDPEREYLLLDGALLQQRGLELVNTSAYLTITGVESIAVYEEILRQVSYHINRGAALYERKFHLSCTEMNGRYSSNEFSVEMNVLHSMNQAAHPNHMLNSQQFIHRGHHLPPELSGHSLASTHNNPMVPSAATVIIVVCVGFLALLVILGILRIHSLHRQGMGQEVPGAATEGHAGTGSKESDLFWDDSALTIIVNPMESYQGCQERAAENCEGRAGKDMEEDDDSSDLETPDSPDSNDMEDRHITGKNDSAHRY